MLLRIRSQDSDCIHRTLNPPSTWVQDVGVNHGRLNVFVTKQFLNRSNVVPLFEQVCSEGVAEGVAGGTLRKPHLSHRILDGALHTPLVNVAAAILARSRVHRSVFLGEHLDPRADRVGSSEVRRTALKNALWVR